MADNFLYHGLHLICLNRIDDEILTFEVILLRSFFETATGLLNTVIQYVWKSQQDRRRDIPQRQFIHHLTQIDLRIILTWCDINIASVVNAKIRGSPPCDVVELL